jgi:hypothetical protein
MTYFVSISYERLKELETLEASIPSMIEKAVHEYKKNNLKKLHERDKANPAAINLRVKRYFERHRDEINKKRREKRLEQKQIKQSTVIVVGSTSDELKPENELLTDESAAVKVKSIFVRVANKVISKSDTPLIRKLAHPVESDDKLLPLDPNRLDDVTLRFDT